MPSYENVGPRLSGFRSDPNFSKAIAAATVTGEADNRNRQDQLAVMDVLANRAAANYAGYGTDVASQAIANQQFSAWGGFIGTRYDNPAQRANLEAMKELATAYLENRAPVLSPAYQSWTTKFNAALEDYDAVMAGERPSIVGPSVNYAHRGLQQLSENLPQFSIGIHDFGTVGNPFSEAAAQRAADWRNAMLHEPATGLTIPSPTGPFDTWGDAGRAEVAAQQFGGIRGLNDFGPPVQDEEWGQTSAPVGPVEFGGALPDITPAFDRAYGDDVRGIPSVPQVPNVSVPDVAAPTTADFTGGMTDGGFARATPEGWNGATTGGGFGNDPSQYAGYGADFSAPGIAPAEAASWSGPLADRAAPDGNWMTGGGFGVGPPGYDPLSSISAPAPSGGFSWSGPLADRTTAGVPTSAPDLGSFMDPANGGSWGGTAGPGRGSVWGSPVEASPAWAEGDYSYNPTEGYQGGVATRPESVYSGYGTFNSLTGPVQGPNRPDDEEDRGFHNAPIMGWSPDVTDYGFSGLNLGGGEPGNFSTVAGITPNRAAPSVSPYGFSGADVSGGYSGGAFNGAPTMAIDNTTMSQPYGGAAYSGPSNREDYGPPVGYSAPPASRIDAAVPAPEPVTTYKEVTRVNPAFTAWEQEKAALQAVPAAVPAPTLGMDFGALPSMAGALGYASSLPGANVTPTPTKALGPPPPQYIKDRVPVTITPPAAPGKPPQQKQRQAVADQTARDFSLAASAGRINATLAAGRPIVDPLTQQTLMAPYDPLSSIQAQMPQPGVLDRLKQALPSLAGVLGFGTGGGSTMAGMDPGVRSVLATNPTLASGYAAGDRAATRAAQNIAAGRAPSAGITDPGEFSRAEGYARGYGGGDYNGGFNSDGSYSGDHGGSTGVGGLW